MKLPESKLTKSQKKTQEKLFVQDGKTYRITVKLRYDDECNNGHNTFAITADIDEKKKNGQWRKDSGGCLHDDIAKHFPKYEKYIKYHLMSSDGPMYYIENSLYWAGKRGYCEGDKDSSPPNLSHFRSTAIWPDSPDDILTWDEERITQALNDRLEKLMNEFKTAMEELGFVY